MAPARRKRAAAPAPTATKRRKQPKTKLHEKKAPTEGIPTRKPRPSKLAIAAPEIGIQGLPAPPYRAVSNAQATLLGLPAELRLHIYTYLTDTTLIHMHRKWDSKTRRHYFTWTPCKGANPSCQLLCANPKWSGLCREEDRCTYKFAAPPDPRGFWGLAATCKFIRNEAQEFFMRNTVISIHPMHVQGWLDRLAKNAPGQLENVRRLTLSGYEMLKGFDQWGMARARARLPNLEAVALQFQEPRWYWASNLADLSIDIKGRWHNWYVLNMTKMFAPTVTVAVESLIWIPSRRLKLPEHGTKMVKEQQIVVRVIREGKGEGFGGTGWADDDVKLELVQPGGLVEPKRNAEWRIWWDATDAYFRG